MTAPGSVSAPEWAVVALGSNLPVREEHLQAGVDHLARVGRVSAVSRIYSSAPVGLSDQPDFLNAVVLMETQLGPEALLTHLLTGEAARGRVRNTPGGARTLDLDLIFHGTARVSTPTLTLPHPSWRERAFVLAPLAEVAAHWVDPATGLTVGRIWESRRGMLPPVRVHEQELVLRGWKPATGISG
ncbi:MAG: 2-amino-4-hydroxy-6-hydroxymethyldihydropteridine diphosphokinase [Gemmatimonadota bacterium]